MGSALQDVLFSASITTSRTFFQTAEFAVQARIDLPRSRLSRHFQHRAYKRLEAEGRILTRDWELYDGQHVVFRPAKLSIENCNKARKTAWKHAYSFSLDCASHPAFTRALAGKAGHQPGLPVLCA